MTATQDLSYRLSDWAEGYTTLTQEYDYAIDEIEGSIPTELKGTLFRNGPGRFDRGGISYKHPFDGDGMICAVSFADGKARFRNRFVRTEGFIEEEKADRILKKNVFATLRPGGFLNNIFDFNFKNVANTNVIYWAGKLLALWEAAPPHRLDPHTLATVGLDDFDGLLKGGLPFSAHPRREAQTGDWLTFGVRSGLQTDLSLFRLKPDGKIIVEGKHTIPGFAFLHDFAFSENYWIFVQNPMALDPLPFVFGFKAAGECLRLAEGQPTRIFLIARRDGKVTTIETDPFFVFHHVNAFEEAGKLILDSVRYPRYITTQEDRDFRETDFSLLPSGQLWRTEIDLQTSRVETEVLLSRTCEFPQVNPGVMGKHHQFVYLAATDSATQNAPLQAIVKFDASTRESVVHSFAPQGFVSEPIFVPSLNGSSEDEGWVLTMVYDSSRNRTDIEILDGQTLQRCARLGLKHHVPYSLHGSFVSEVFAG
jgi:all-trans-8'-apo-beta-carotenal 15,15'-oxygenase